MLNLHLSKKETFHTSALGKTFTYFSLKDLISKLDKPIFHLFGENAPGNLTGYEKSLGKPVVEGFFLCGDKSTADAFMTVARLNDTTAAYFDEKKIQLKDATVLIDAKY